MGMFFDTELCKGDTNMCNKSNKYAIKVKKEDQINFNTKRYEYHNMKKPSQVIKIPWNVFSKNTEWSNKEPQFIFKMGKNKPIGFYWLNIPFDLKNRSIGTSAGICAKLENSSTEKANTNFCRAPEVSVINLNTGQGHHKRCVFHILHVHDNQYWK